MGASSLEVPSPLAEGAFLVSDLVIDRDRIRRAGSILASVTASLTLPLLLLRLILLLRLWLLLLLLPDMEFGSEGRDPGRDPQDDLRRSGLLESVGAEVLVGKGLQLIRVVSLEEQASSASALEDFVDAPEEINLYSGPGNA